MVQCMQNANKEKEKETANSMAEIDKARQGDVSWNPKLWNIYYFN